MMAPTHKRDSKSIQQTWHLYWAMPIASGRLWTIVLGCCRRRGRKSVEPLAAVTAPERTAAQHQSLLHFVAQAPWSDQAMLRRVRERVLPSITRDEPIQAWIIDDTGFPKKGGHSVGVARQYCGLFVVYDTRRDCTIRTGVRRVVRMTVAQRRRQGR